MPMENNYALLIHYRTNVASFFWWLLMLFKRWLFWHLIPIALATGTPCTDWQLPAIWFSGGTGSVLPVRYWCWVTRCRWWRAVVSGDGDDVKHSRRALLRCTNHCSRHILDRAAHRVYNYRYTIAKRVLPTRPTVVKRHLMHCWWHYECSATALSPLIYNRRFLFVMYLPTNYMPCRYHTAFDAICYMHYDTAMRILRCWPVPVFRCFLIRHCCITLPACRYRCHSIPSSLLSNYGAMTTMPTILMPYSDTFFIDTFITIWLPWLSYSVLVIDLFKWWLFIDAHYSVI